MSPSVIRIRRGMNIRMVGAPAREVLPVADGPTVAVFPGEYPGVKPRLCVSEGQTVRRGQAVFEDKANPAFRGCSPAGGTVRRVEYGARRSLEKIVIEVAAREEAESFPRFTRAQLDDLPRERMLEILQASGYWALLRERPFDRMPQPQVRPKALFVNGMATAPFRPDFSTVVKGDEAAFEAGLAAMRRLTAGPVYLCLAESDAPSPPAGAAGVETRYFSGPHPSGNTSVHIHHLAPVRPGEHVWTIRATDVILIGRLLLTGDLPATRVVTLGGSGVRDGAARHYRMRIGGELGGLLKGRVTDGEIRVVAGDALTGSAVDAGGHLRFLSDAVTLLPEDRERHLLGWMAPGVSAFSFSPLFFATWFRRATAWRLGTNRHGNERPMTVTGLYDRFFPMRILPDFLLRAVLARDFEEAVNLGLLEVAPEDFALPAFVCPSKMDLVGIIRSGLAEAEAEGI